jgi:hypothetical protein
MTNISMSASDMLKHMENGAQFHRAIGDRIELRIPGKENSRCPRGSFRCLDRGVEDRFPERTAKRLLSRQKNLTAQDHLCRGVRERSESAERPRALILGRRSCCETT